MSGQFLITVHIIQPEMKFIAGVISLRLFWQKWNFISGDKISCKHHPKWNHMKGNICTCVNKNDWLLLNGPFISEQPRNEIHFISTATKSIHYFMVGWNFLSGRFYFGSHVNTLVVKNYLQFLITFLLFELFQILCFSVCWFWYWKYKNLLILPEISWKKNKQKLEKTRGTHLYSNLLL